MKKCLMFKNNFILINGLIVACLLAGCAKQVVIASSTPVAVPDKTVAEKIPTAEIKPSNGVKIATPKITDASQFLNFVEEFSIQNADLQKQTLHASNQALAINPNDLLNRMKLILMYGLPNSSFQDTLKAQNLLQRVLEESVLSHEQLAFGNLMFDYFVALNKLGSNVKNDQKKLETLQQKNEALQSKLDATQQKLDASQKQLNAIKNIEKSLGERETLPKDSPAKEQLQKK
jgi:hypothetical protein